MFLYSRQSGKIDIDERHGDRLQFGISNRLHFIPDKNTVSVGEGKYQAKPQAFAGFNTSVNF